MILVTGPTGSGKTVSLYTCLNILNQPGVNISTVEDPAEINLPGINQVNVNDKAGLTFAAALKSFLRQDPDVIMVGEIRDLETADIAIKAAQTGHMVMSTLHTNDAPTTLTRLLNMGVAPFNIASSVLLITAQRLARKLCENCKTPADYPREAMLKAGFKAEDLDGTWKPYRAVGCSACNNGYKGRVGIYQVMPITEEIQRIILAEGTAMDIAEQAQREGVRDLRQSGLIKVRAGVDDAGRSHRGHQRVRRPSNDRHRRQLGARAERPLSTRWRLHWPRRASRNWSSNGKARTRTARSSAARCAPAARRWSAPACAARASWSRKVKKRRTSGGRSIKQKDIADLHAPAVDHDARRRAAAAVVRHRRAAAAPTRSMTQAADRHPRRRRDRHQPVVGLPQAPAVLRRAVLQPRRGRRGGRYSGSAARPPGACTRKRRWRSRTRSSRR